MSGSGNREVRPNYSLSRILLFVWFCLLFFDRVVVKTLDLRPSRRWIESRS